ncbi:MAG TPA: carbon-nitrogen family hydrolase, partial [Ignavibacteriaceae bacterium]|nr:carbon-nitrogen family hydrolase [Ignavibacteriaceae bacterium]
QYNPSWEDKNKNQEKILSLLEKEPPQNSLLIFPEMTLTGFSMNTEKLSEERDGESFKFFSDVAKKYSSNIMAGIIEKSGTDYFNTLLHIDSSGALLNYYRKIHPFSFSDEDKNFTGSNKPVITEIGKCKIGLSICYDLRFPELFRFYAKERIDLIINIANWPTPRIEHWKTLLKARAIENQCFVAGCNRISSDPYVEYNGFSSIFDPMGHEVLSIENKEGIFSAEIDIKKVEEVRSRLPFLNDIKLI